MASSSEDGEAPLPPLSHQDQQQEDKTLTTSLDQMERSPPATNGGGGDLAAAAAQGGGGDAAELFKKGVKAVEDGDYVDAVDCFSRALEIRVAHYGELSPECSIYYYKYGSALLYKSQEEADPLGNVPKSAPTNLDKDKNVGVTEGSKATTSSGKEYNASSSTEKAEDGASDEDQEDDNEGSDGDGEALADVDEDDSDLDLAWKMLDVARAIVEKSPEDTIEKVNIFAALGEVSMEREDFETSLNDYLKALSILERLVEPDSRRIIELNFRICLVLEVWSKVEEAIPYCQKAISLCKSRLKWLSEDAKPAPFTDNNVSVLNNSGIGGNQSPVDGDLPIEEDEKEVLCGILSELERKLEDLQHVLSDPKSIFSEIMKMAASKSAASARCDVSITESGLNSSVAGGGFDSPTVLFSSSTSATTNTNGVGITHLGVVGRGVKRAASINSVASTTTTEPCRKKQIAPIQKNDGSSVSETPKE